MLATDPVYELGGPCVYRYDELLRIIAREEGRRRIYVPVPMFAWKAAARVAELLPGAPITRSQVELMRVNNCPSPALPGFADLAVEPRGPEDLLRRDVRGETCPQGGSRTS